MNWIRRKRDGCDAIGRSRKKNKKIQGRNRKSNETNSVKSHDTSHETMLPSGHGTISHSNPGYYHVIGAQKTGSVWVDLLSTHQGCSERRNLGNQNLGQLFLYQLLCRRCKNVAKEYDGHLTHLNVSKVRSD